MKKLTVFLIILIFIIIFSALGWFLFLRNTDVPLSESISDILPFGSGNVDNPGLVRDPILENPTDSAPVDKFASPTSDLFRLADTPIAGSVIFKRNAQTVVRYVDRATGNIYEVVITTTASSTTANETRLTNNTLPKIYEANFRADGGAVLFRSLNNDTDLVENTLLTLTPPQANSTSTEFYTVSSVPIRGEVVSVAEGDSNTLYYYQGDASSIVASTYTDTNKRTLLNTAFSGWNFKIAGNNLLAYTKASADAPGFAYTISTSGGNLTKILGPFAGLVVMPNSAGNRILYSYIENNRMYLSTENLQSGASIKTSIETIAEKCVWSTKNVDGIFCAVPVDWTPVGQPDLWYKGIAHFNDRIWSLDISNDVTEILAEPSQSPGVEIDAVDLKLSPDENLLIFTNKRDLSLWALKLQ